MPSAPARVVPTEPPVDETGSTEPAAEPAVENAFRFRLLEPEEYQLDAAYQTLERVAAYVPLVHGGWVEPGQTPEFDEYTVVLRGELQVKTHDGVITVKAGQAVHTRPGEWVQYSTPHPDGAEYIAVCLPAFSPTTVHRDAQGER